MGVLMRLWLYLPAAVAAVLTGTICVCAAAPMARGGGGAFVHAGRPVAAARPSGGVAAHRPGHGFRPGRRPVGFALAGTAYGYDPSWNDIANGIPESDAAPAAAVAAQPVPYDCGAPTSATACFRPRLIMVGRPARHGSYLPHVVYGGPLPCGYTAAQPSL